MGMRRGNTAQACWGSQCSWRLAADAPVMILRSVMRKLSPAAVMTCATGLPTACTLQHSHPALPFITFCSQLLRHMCTAVCCSSSSSGGREISCEAWLVAQAWWVRHCAEPLDGRGLGAGVLSPVWHCQHMPADLLQTCCCSCGCPCWRCKKRVAVGPHESFRGRPV